MADFFGGISSGVRMPETVMNSGPLPPLNMAGMPYGLDGTPDARINYNSSLLGEISPYAYGEPDRLSTQSSYINIPNRIQKVVPLLHLPSTDDAEKTFLLTHCVDDGDVCFALQDTYMKTVDDAKGLERVYSHKNYHPFINLATVNYILAAGSMLRIGRGFLNDTEWRKFFTAMGIETSVLPSGTTKSILGVKHFLDLARPFGIAHGSEKQGGGHEGTNSAVTWASNFVTTMYVDGHVQNLANLWRGVDIHAGDHLVLALKEVELPESYTLNHYAKATVVKRFTLRGAGARPKVVQLVPGVLDRDTAENHMYWKIAMSYVRGKAYDSSQTTFHDDSALLRGALLEACFQPSLHYRHKLPGGGVPLAPFVLPPPATTTTPTPAGGGSATTTTTTTPPVPATTAPPAPATTTPSFPGSGPPADTPVIPPLENTEEVTQYLDETAKEYLQDQVAYLENTVRSMIDVTKKESNLRKNIIGNLRSAVTMLVGAKKDLEGTEPTPENEDDRKALSETVTTYITKVTDLYSECIGYLSSVDQEFDDFRVLRQQVEQYSTMCRTLVQPDDYIHSWIKLTEERMTYIKSHESTVDSNLDKVMKNLGYFNALLKGSFEDDDFERMVPESVRHVISDLSSGSSSSETMGSEFHAYASALRASMAAGFQGAVPVVVSTEAAVPVVVSTEAAVSVEAPLEAVAPTEPKPAEKKPSKRRVQTTVLGEGGSSRSLAEVI